MSLLEIRAVAPAHQFAGLAFSGGGSTRIASAPQSASVRTREPARASVRSITLNRDNGDREAGFVVLPAGMFRRAVRYFRIVPGHARAMADAIFP